MSLTTQQFAVGRYLCTVTAYPPMEAPVGHLVVTWTPGAPSALTPDERLLYRERREAAIAELVSEAGGDALVIEL